MSLTGSPLIFSFSSSASAMRSPTSCVMPYCEALPLRGKSTPILISAAAGAASASATAKTRMRHSERRAIEKPPVGVPAVMSRHAHVVDGAAADKGCQHLSSGIPPRESS